MSSVIRRLGRVVGTVAGPTIRAFMEGLEEGETGSRFLEGRAFYRGLVEDIRLSEQGLRAVTGNNFRPTLYMFSVSPSRPPRQDVSVFFCGERAYQTPWGRIPGIRLSERLEQQPPSPDVRALCAGPFAYSDTYREWAGQKPDGYALVRLVGVKQVVPRVSALTGA